MSLKKFPTLLLSSDLIVSISFDEYCSNVRFALEKEDKFVIENVTRAALLGALKDITKSLSIIFQSEGYEILNPSIGFSTVKKCFGSNVVDDDAIAFDIPLLSIKANNNNDNRIIIVNSRYLRLEHILPFMPQIILTFTIS